MLWRTKVGKHENIIKYKELINHVFMEKHDKLRHKLASRILNALKLIHKFSLK